MLEHYSWKILIKYQVLYQRSAKQGERDIDSDINN